MQVTYYPMYEVDRDGEVLAEWSEVVGRADE